MKSIVVFYSLEGNTRLIAEKLAKTINSEILELKPKNEVKSNGFSKYIWGGKQVLFKEKPELMPFNNNFEKYDLIIFGSPIWAGKSAPAFNTFFKSSKITGKKVALFNCNGGGSSAGFFKKFKEVLNGNEFVGEIAFKDPLKENTDDNLKQAAEWIKEIAKKI